MTVRSIYVGTATPGEVLTAAHYNELPGGWLGYAEDTDGQAGITAEADLTGLTVTVTVNTSRRIRISGVTRTSSSVAADRVTVRIKESTTVLQESTLIIVTNGQVVTVPKVEWVGTPSAGSHTYKLTMLRTSGTGSLNLESSATTPAYILVEDLGPAS